MDTVRRISPPTPEQLKQQRLMERLFERKSGRAPAMNE
jgi:hypothetical protein